MIKPSLETKDFLIAEYEYIAETILRTNADESRVSTFFNLVVTVGTASTGLFFSNQTVEKSSLSFIFAILFTALTLIGMLTIAQLARLRAAWHESVEAMNTIKDFYIRHHPEFESAIKWRAKQVPFVNKPYSIANLIAIEIAMLGSLTTGGAMYFLLSYLGEVNWVGSLIVFASIILGYVAQWSFYLHLLVDDR